MVMALRPTALDDLGLIPAIRRYADYMVSPNSIDVTVESTLGERRLPSECEIAVFRIVQEALNNVVRHSGATSASVRVTRNQGTLTVEVEDDGRGLPETHSTDPMSGVGIEGMEERAELLGGQLRIESSPGRGTLVRLTASVERDDY